MKHTKTKAPECVLRSKKAANQIAKAYSYLIHEYAPLPEEHLLLNCRVTVMDVTVENAIKAYFAKSKALGRIIPNNRSECIVTIQYLYWDMGNFVHREDHLEAFIDKYCYEPDQYFLYCHEEFANYLAGCFSPGMEISIKSDIHITTIMQYKTRSLTITRLRVMPWVDIFDAYPALQLKYLPPSDYSIESSHTVVVEFHYNGVDQTPQIAILPDLLNRHCDMAAMVEYTYFTFKAA